MHWTLKFLGDVDILETPAICDAVGRAVESLASFDVETHGVGAFPDVHRPRTVWIGMGRGSEQMIELHDASSSSWPSWATARRTAASART